jgi:hypothetical protein
VLSRGKASAACGGVATLGKRSRERLERAIGTEAQAGAHRLGGVFQLREVVVPRMQDLGHLVGRRFGAAQVLQAVAAYEVEQLVDEVGEPLAFLDQDGDELLALARRQIDVVVQDLGEGANRGQQGQQLVARGREIGILGEARAEAADVLAGVPIGAVEGQERLAGRRRAADQLVQLGGPEFGVLEQRIAQQLGQIGQKPGLVVAREGLKVDIEAFGELEQERPVEAALVMLDQVQVARRYAQLRGHRDLGQALLIAQPAHPVAQHGLPWHRWSSPRRPVLVLLILHIFVSKRHRIYNSPLRREGGIDAVGR